MSTYGFEDKNRGSEYRQNTDPDMKSSNMRDSQRKIKKSVVFDENRNEVNFYDKSDPSNINLKKDQDKRKHAEERIIDINELRESRIK